MTTDLAGPLVIKAMSHPRSGSARCFVGPWVRSVFFPRFVTSGSTNPAATNSPARSPTEYGGSGCLDPYINMDHTATREPPVIEAYGTVCRYNTPSNLWTDGTYSCQLSRIIYCPHKPTRTSLLCTLCPHSCAPK
jgi:hypothetical protein